MSKRKGSVLWVDYNGRYEVAVVVRKTDEEVTIDWGKGVVGGKEIRDTIRVQDLLFLSPVRITGY